MLKTKLFSILLIVVVLLNVGCAAIWVPKKQNVTFSTQHDQAKVYVDNIQVSSGKSGRKKVIKDGTQQIIVKTPGYKDEYKVLVPRTKDGLYIGLHTLSWFCFLYPGYAESLMPMSKKNRYAPIQDVSSKTKLVTRGENDKYVNIENVGINIKNTKKDIVYHEVVHNDDLNRAMREAEDDTKQAELKAELKEAKQIKKKGKTELLQDDKITYDDTKFTPNLKKALVSSGFIDTLNAVFKDNNNTLTLDATINKIDFYLIRPATQYGYYNRYAKIKCNLTWRLKNTYGEVIDSTIQDAYSGDFVLGSEEMTEKMFTDAIEVSFYNFLSGSTIKKYISQEKYKAPDLQLLKLNAPNQVVQELGDGLEASVIVKRKDRGHGTGFAITNDGYLITNFHVIAEREYGKYKDIKVILPNGEERTAKVIRVNREKDLALLKVEANFEKAFKVSNIKSFKRLQEVYTVGTPKSIELGQTLSTGILSNERNSNNNNLLQLSMSINGGNSGGALFDKTGALHGVIVAKLVGESTEGIAFAIPAYLIPEYLNIKY